MMKYKFELINKGNGTYSVYWQNLNTGDLTPFGWSGDKDLLIETVKETAEQYQSTKVELLKFIIRLPKNEQPEYRKKFFECRFNDRIEQCKELIKFLESTITEG